MGCLHQIVSSGLRMKDSMSPPSTGESRGSRLHQASLHGRKTEAGALLAPASSYPLPLSWELALPLTGWGASLSALDFSLPRQLVLASRMRQVDVCCSRIHVLRKLRELGRKILRVRGSDWLQENSILQTQLDCCTYELRDNGSTHTACTGSTGPLHIWTQRQRQHTHGLHGFQPDCVPALKGGSRHGLPCTIKKLPATDTYLQSKNGALSLPEYINNLRVGPMPSSKVNTHTHKNPQYFCLKLLYLSIFFVLWVFCLFILVSIFWMFCMLG